MLITRSLLPLTHWGPSQCARLAVDRLVASSSMTPRQRPQARSPGVDSSLNDLSGKASGSSRTRRPASPVASGEPRSKRHKPSQQQSRTVDTARGSIACHAAEAAVQIASLTQQAPATSPQLDSSSEQDGDLWLIVGLGNPGGNYERTRHNVGFMVVDELARLEDIDCRKLEKSAAVGRGKVAGRQVMLVKPVTFMNNSGESVSALAKLYNVPVSRILVITDDLDQPTAGVKLKPKGGHGGHNGLRSIIACMGDNKDFPRLKIGIGRPTEDLPIPSYVLQNFSKSEQELIDSAIKEGVQIVRSILSLGLEKALSGVRV